ncbi:hypothetical protein L0665_03620 [Methanogenium marinum]|uniref:Uncharacterized protein n=1 Tax=Methanogenium marinum TaxID=348610 RepID=A0A9Q4KUU0_9EURY|nr:hypothetical protein [Methanogenium marinum]MDE4907701.1 hypothetical protein [Methanogenium marinum]
MIITALFAGCTIQTDTGKTASATLQELPPTLNPENYGGYTATGGLPSVREQYSLILFSGTDYFHQNQQYRIDFEIIKPLNVLIHTATCNAKQRRSI